MRSAPVTTLALLLGLALGGAPASVQAMDPNAAAAAPETAAAKPQPAPNAERSVKPPKKQRTFHGTVARVDPRGVTVALRSGKERRFPKTADAAVRGQKRSWSDLAAGDPVTLRVRGKRVYAVVVEPDAAARAEIDAKREAMLKKEEERAKKAQAAPPRRQPKHPDAKAQTR